MAAKCSLAPLTKRLYQRCVTKVLEMWAVLEVFARISHPKVSVLPKSCQPCTHHIMTQHIMSHVKVAPQQCSRPVAWAPSRRAILLAPPSILASWALGSGSARCQTGADTNLKVGHPRVPARAD